MPFLDNIKSRLSFLGRIPKRYYLIGSIILIAVAYVLLFHVRTIALSYDGSTCDRRAVLLPGLYEQAAGDSGYEIEASGGLTLGGLRLTATSICITPVASPEEYATDTLAYAPWGGWFARFIYKLETGAHPALDTSVLQNAVPVSRSLEVPLSTANELFSYKIATGAKEAACDSQDDRLVCDVPALELQQSKQYDVSFTKYFDDEPVGEAVTAAITTLSPLSVRSSSIKQGATVYAKPQNVTLNVDKTLAKAEFTAERIDGKKPVTLAATSKIDGKKVVIEFAEALPRKAKIQLQARHFEAADGSTTLDPYKLTFTTSGGPRVAGVNVGSTGVSIGTTIAVTFDQVLDPKQDISQFITTKGGVRYQGSQGNQLLFDTSGVGKCAAMTIALTKDIKSRHGLSGDSEWAYNGRARCYTMSTIGYSRQGRAINAYYFGGGGTTVLYVGAIHGNEPSSQYILDDWIAELDANPGRIPSNRQVVVVPSLNPDGIAIGSRNNIAGVNLDRNFPTDDWKSDIHSADGFRKGGGGPKPLSEPESRAIAGLVQRLKPRLMLSYHSQGSLVMGDPGVYSETYATQYASMVGYRDATRASSESLFGYDGSSGLFEGWAYLKAGVPNIVVELSGHYTREFPRHREAFWAMLR